VARRGGGAPPWPRAMCGDGGAALEVDGGRGGREHNRPDGGGAARGEDDEDQHAGGRR
jgi:hypothetical protein